ncbi:MAG: class I SAM-dependent methyltransferase [Micromonosporaceae bacterium]|nr:class I SAM-dependent methyltransferase [Micromonosporaceae bacterium]
MDDTATVARREYQALDPLSVRIQTHRRYSERDHDIEAAVDRAVGLPASAALLDIGPGTGTYLRRLAERGHRGRLVGLDISAAVLAGLGTVPGVRAVLGDAAALPLRDGCFDVVTARHMLYHVADPLAAIRHARRVLHSGGTFAAVVNVEDNLPVTRELIRGVLAAHGLDARAHAHRVHGGNLPAMVREVFGEVRVHRQDNALVFPSAEPVVAYALSCLTLYGVRPEHYARAAVESDLAVGARALFAQRTPGGRDQTGQPVLRDPKGYVIVTARA